MTWYLLHPAPLYSNVSGVHLNVWLVRMQLRDLSGPETSFSCPFPLLFIFLCAARWRCLNDMKACTLLLIKGITWLLFLNFALEHYNLLVLQRREGCFLKAALTPNYLKHRFVPEFFPAGSRPFGGGHLSAGKIAILLQTADSAAAFGRNKKHLKKRTTKLLFIYFSYTLPFLFEN